MSNTRRRDAFREQEVRALGEDLETILDGVVEEKVRAALSEALDDSKLIQGLLAHYKAEMKGIRRELVEDWKKDLQATVDQMLTKGLDAGPSAIEKTSIPAWRDAGSSALEQSFEAESPRPGSGAHAPSSSPAPSDEEARLRAQERLKPPSPAVDDGLAGGVSGSPREASPRHEDKTRNVLWALGGVGVVVLIAALLFLRSLLGNTQGGDAAQQDGSRARGVDSNASTSSTPTGGGAAPVSPPAQKLLSSDLATKGWKLVTSSTDFKNKIKDAARVSELRSCLLPEQVPTALADLLHTSSTQDAVASATVDAARRALPPCFREGIDLQGVEALDVAIQATIKEVFTRVDAGRLALPKCGSLVDYFSDLNAADIAGRDSAINSAVANFKVDGDFGRGSQRFLARQARCLGLASSAGGSESSNVTREDKRLLTYLALHHLGGATS